MKDEKMINAALRLLRLAHGMRAKDLSGKLKISSSYLSEIESGKKTPSLELLHKYSNLFGLYLSTLILFAEELDNKTTVEEINCNTKECFFMLMKLIEQYPIKAV